MVDSGTKVVFFYGTLLPAAMAPPATLNVASRDYSSVHRGEGALARRGASCLIGLLDLCFIVCWAEPCHVSRTVGGSAFATAATPTCVLLSVSIILWTSREKCPPRWACLVVLMAAAADRLNRADGWRGVGSSPSWSWQLSSKMLS